jgi:hypothetical protein
MSLTITDRRRHAFWSRPAKPGHYLLPNDRTTRKVEAKKGISGGKATGAVLTAGISILATGLSRKETVTQVACTNCKSQWTF